MDPEKSNDSGIKPEDSPPEKVLSSGIQLRASARVSKKLRLDQEALAQAQSPEKKSEPPPDASGSATEEKRRRRPPVLWSAEDKAAFFEALNEHGKNFEAIEKHMTSRVKKRGDGAAKNRARCFYYRAWHKLSRYVQFPPGVEKVTQELYTLINFGELRKKIGHITEKNAQKLNELIYIGRTQVRVSGKTWRIKTPVCPALRRLNKLGEDCEEVRLPSKIEVLLSPRTNKDSIPARKMGHNPRARAVLGLDCNIHTILTFLNARWSSLGQDEELWIGPKTDAVITQPHVKCGPAVNSGAVSLIAHEQRRGGDSAELQALLEQLHIRKTKAVKKEVASTTEDITNTEILEPLVVEPQSSSHETSPPENKEEKEVDETDFVARAREGWNMDSSSGTKIGQLYMMLGSKGVIELEYWWTSPDSPSEVSKVLQRLVSLARLFHFKPKVECHCGHKCKPSAKPGAVDAGKALKRPVNPKKKLSNVDISSVSSHTVDVTKSAEEKTGLEVNQQIVSGPFKHPLLPAPLSQSSSSSTIDPLKKLQTFRPKFCNRRGRSRTRSMVVQRMLPLLPKSLPPSLPPLMVTLITPPSGAKPVATTLSDLKEEVSSSKVPSISTLMREEVIIDNKAGLLNLQASEAHLNEGAVLENEEVKCNGAGLLNQEGGPIPLVQNPDASESVPLSTNTFKGILGGNTDCGELDDTPPSSPTTILKEGEGQWLSSEVTDFSLSSFLGHLESPMKVNGASTADDIQISTDVDSHFQSLMAESSLDYTAKFADLAEKIAGGAGPHV